MANITRQRVARNVGRPFMLCCVCASDANVSRLKRFELLLCAEFIGHGGDVVVAVWACWRRIVVVSRKQASGGPDCGEAAGMPRQCASTRQPTL